MIKKQLSSKPVSKMLVTVVGGVVLSMSMAISVHADDEYAVSYSVGELTSYHGVEDVHERIVEAAEQYCPTYAQIRSHQDVRTCVEGVVSDLVEKVNHPQLTSFHTQDETISIALMPTVKEDPSIAQGN